MIVKIVKNCPMCQAVHLLEFDGEAPEPERSGKFVWCGNCERHFVAIAYWETTSVRAEVIPLN